MYRLIYSCLFYLSIPFVLLRLLRRSVREPGYRHAIGERFGAFCSARPDEIIWVHAVSAGETIAAAPLIRRLLDAGFPCLVTNMTPTGRDRVRVLLGDEVENCYAPYDLPGSIGRFLNHNRPKMLITIDTELWPNMLAVCEKRQIPAVIVNARMAVRSAEGYARFPGLTGPMLKSLDLIAVQTRSHAARFESLGAHPERVHVTGSIKFDGQNAQGHEERLGIARDLTAGRTLMLAASTHEGEEAALLRVLSALEVVVPDVLLVLAPRHSHRTEAVIGACNEAGYSPVLFSDRAAVEAVDRVLVLDVMGELEPYFSLARVAFIGGSLVPVGGHNLLEAVRARTAVVMGPHLDNVEDITQQFVDNHAMIIAASEKELNDAIIGLMRDEGAANRLSDAAMRVLDENRGSIDRTMTLLGTVLEGKNDTG